MTRPTEIQQLVDWLREPGRKLAHGWGTEQAPCALHKLHNICGGDEPIVGWTKICDFLHAKIGLKESIATQITLVNDKQRNPLAIAAYLEAQFPQGNTEKNEVKPS